MPIKDKSLYPADWKQIRQRILERDNHCCKFCGVNNYALGYRDQQGNFIECEGMALESASLLDNEKIIKIILTIAHLHDPTPSNCNDDNLAALCQKCHNTLDAPMRAKNAAKTRALKKVEKEKLNGQERLFSE